MSTVSRDVFGVAAGEHGDERDARAARGGDDLPIALGEPSFRQLRSPPRADPLRTDPAPAR